MKPIKVKLMFSKTSSNRNSWAYVGASHGAIITLIYVRKDKLKEPPPFIDVEAVKGEF